MGNPGIGIAAKAREFSPAELNLLARGGQSIAHHDNKAMLLKRKRRTLIRALAPGPGTAFGRAKKDGAVWPAISGVGSRTQ